MHGDGVCCCCWHSDQARRRRCLSLLPAIMETRTRAGLYILVRSRRKCWVHDVTVPAASRDSVSDRRDVVNGWSIQWSQELEYENAQRMQTTRSVRSCLYMNSGKAPGRSCIHRPSSATTNELFITLVHTILCYHRAVVAKLSRRYTRSVGPSLAWPSGAGTKRSHHRKHSLVACMYQLHGSI